MNTLNLFNELLDLISATGDMDVAAFGKGFSRKDIETMIKIHPIPESLITIYSCVRGVSQRDDGFFLFGWKLLAIDEINDEIDMLTDLKARYPLDCNYQLDMIPFLINGCGDNLSVRTLKDDQSVWHLMHDGDGCMVHRSIDDFLLTAIECYKQGVYYFDEEEGIWSADYDLFIEIGEKLNPEVDFRLY
jgi:hypothetical protein